MIIMPVQEKMKFDANGSHIDAFEQPMWAGMKDYE